jgi:hypothetical protein
VTRKKGFATSSSPPIVDCWPIGIPALADPELRSIAYFFQFFGETGVSPVPRHGKACGYLYNHLPATRELCETLFCHPERSEGSLIS